MILFKEKYGTLEYDESVPCITGTFLGFMSSEVFREFLLKGLFYLKEKKKQDEPILWLADTKKHQVQGAEDLKWVAKEVQLIVELVKKEITRLYDTSPSYNTAFSDQY